MVSYTLVAHKLLMVSKCLISSKKISTLLLSGNELELVDGVRFYHRIETQAFFRSSEILDVGSACVQSGPKSAGLSVLRSEKTSRIPPHSHRLGR